MTENDVIGIEYDHFTYEFDVIAVQPSHAVSILDSDVSVDIMEPLELQKIFHMEVKFGDTKQFNLKKGEYAYFKGKIRIWKMSFKVINKNFNLVDVVDPNTSLNIKLMFEEGTAEFYVSSLREYPTRVTQMWTSEQNLIPSDPNKAKSVFNSYDGSKSIVIDMQDPAFKVTWHFIAIHCDIAESCKGSITIKNGTYKRLQ